MPDEPTLNPDPGTGPGGEPFTPVPKPQPVPTDGVIDFPTNPPSPEPDLNPDNVSPTDVTDTVDQSSEVPTPGGPSSGDSAPPKGCCQEGEDKCPVCPSEADSIRDYCMIAAWATVKAAEMCTAHSDTVSG